MKLSTIVKGGLHLAKLVSDLLFVWLTLGWNVRKGKKAFEKELLRSGMPKEAVKRLGNRYSSVKDEVLRQVWRSVGKFRS